MWLLIQLIVNGLFAGAIYSLIAVGFAIIYNSTRIFHIAHGAVFTFGAYVFYLLAVPLHLSYVVAIPGAVLGSALLGIATELIVYRPLRARSGGLATALIASIGMLTLLQSLYALAFTTDSRTLRQGALPSYSVGEITFTSLHVVIVVVALVVFPLLQLFLTRSTYGKAIRALADNPRLAVALGMDTKLLYLLVFGIGSALAGIAATLISLELGAKPDMGFNIVFIATVAVIIGGVGYLPGALLGAFILGLLQQLSIWQINSAWQNAIVFGVLMVFLVLRPQGVFGSKLNVRRA